MSVTVTAQISGQEVVDSTLSYCYLYEPLRVYIAPTDLTVSKVYIDITLKDLYSVLDIEYEKYAEFDISPSVGSTMAPGITVDLMKIAQQVTDTNVYRFPNVDEIASSVEGNKSIYPVYWYIFKIYSDAAPTSPYRVYKMPIMGGRDYETFVPTVDALTPITEFEYYGLDIDELEARWSGVSLVQASLGSVGQVPSITEKTNSGNPPCGGFLIWKSRMGGWMFWGFKIQTRTFKKKYKGRLDVDMFESFDETNGDPYVPVDYTNIEMSYTRTLKALGLSSDELLAVSGIHASPAIYYQESGANNLELMRLSSFSAPISTLSNGGDFTVTLKSISRTSQITI